MLKPTTYLPSIYLLHFQTFILFLNLEFCKQKITLNGMERYGQSRYCQESHVRWNMVWTYVYKLGQSWPYMLVL